MNPKQVWIEIFWHRCPICDRVVPIKERFIIFEDIILPTYYQSFEQSLFHKKITSQLQILRIQIFQTN